MRSRTTTIATTALAIALLLGIAGCTEESRNKIFRGADNVLGKDYKITYVKDQGQPFKSWTVRDGKITAGKTKEGLPLGYYYFWSEESGYVQVPVERTIIEEIRD